MISESVICALITATGVVASALIAIPVAKKSARTQVDVEIIKQNAELKKKNMEWQHLFEQENDKVLSEILTLVPEMLRLRKNGVSGNMYREALEKINFLRVRETGRMKALLDILYYDLESWHGRMMWDEDKIKSTLARIVDEQRHQKNEHCGHDATSAV